MNRELNEKSERVQEEEITDSVYDFLYHDGRRIASLLAQFDPSGHLTQLSEGRSARRARDSTTDIMTSGGVPAIAKLQSANKEHVHRAHEEEISRVYDPMWANARELLDQLDGRGLIVRDISSAQIGQIVLFTGDLSIYDLEMLAGIWRAPAMRKFMTKSLPDIPEIPKSLRNNATLIQAQKAVKATRSAAEDHLNLFSEIIPLLPHTVQSSVSGSNGVKVWSSLEKGGLTVAAGNITLNHGVSIPGEWAILGILDAHPLMDRDVKVRDQTPGGEEMLAKLFEALAPVVRQMLGRPRDAYGVTPLLVFREIESLPGTFQDS
ncbi:hypothetical protein [Salipiger marinus]|uniref:Uncharacterized protein n=1 Tax=Salipiger marinus TaxID=555512 RepID=A0A1G8PUJ1_9RHOB|nr:hypothetical protein [Salipiger marinus]SDI95540.1 hypothetical protein SAMN04487993_101396 [Salipiger marinus]